MWVAQRPGRAGRRSEDESMTMATIFFTLRKPKAVRRISLILLLVAPECALECLNLVAATMAKFLGNHKEHHRQRPLKYYHTRSTIGRNRRDISNIRDRSGCPEPCAESYDPKILSKFFKKDSICPRHML